jgi:hypothetical protein
MVNLNIIIGIVKFWLIYLLLNFKDAETNSARQEQQKFV